MKTLSQITEIIANQIASVAEDLMNDQERSDLYGDYDVVVCSERIFVEDYLPREEEYIARNSELDTLNYQDPNDQPYRNKIFVVINLASGQKNYAVSNSDCTIDVLSEENDIVFARALLDEFSSRYNFLFDGGIVQAYFTPNVNSALEEVYTGFRALLSLRGFVRVPEAGFAFVNKITISFNYGGSDIDFDIPFTNLQYNWASQPDPQAFSGTGGQTKALNRQSTTVVSFSTYLNFDEEKADGKWASFSKRILLCQNGEQNAKFRIRMVTPYKDSSDNDIAICDKWFILVNAGYNQELGDIDPWSLSFSEAKEVES